MELDDIKKLWKEEYNELEKRISINEQKINDMDMKKQIRGFERLFRISILGGHMALFYMLIAFMAAYWMRGELIYSIPAVLSGLAMLISFNQHRVLKMPDSSRMSVVELQKSISKFRIHSAKYKYFDVGVVTFWLLTLIPIYVKWNKGVSIYTEPGYLVQYGSIAGVLLLVSFFAVHFSYKKMDDDLLETEDYLNKLSAFER